MTLPPVSYSLEIADVYALQKLNLRRQNPNFWLLTHVFPTFIGALMLLFLVVQILTRDWFFASGDWFTTLCALVVMISTFFWRPISRFFLKRRLLKNPLFGASATLQLNERGVQSEGQSGESLVFWSHILGIADEAHHIFLFLSNETAFIIPKRAFDSPENVRNFADFAQNQWGKAHPTTSSAPPISAPD